ncbi:dienelactone hydrolase family protein [Aliiglaciecola sp. 2_MG-2023]|uniref:dienelactone hydrolase family protein n=1 Tax=Alteromonadaceae TaxID=72275 RepID=UPI0026E18EE3|nr:MULTISPECIES: dienelactone hydrolase family protein [unclassified Aliiglaciecola]MDO6711725.1 dienelactone hydrolase family protein [Aliiglaciecola sp. 2_MG-2023]MDO6752796.1 dienelactone hydrolase family protein [Aliiglaciecola sp. 1_MG-2023]
MNKNINLTAEDGHKFTAYLAEPENPKAGLVIIQEIFGITEHLKSVAREFAELGYKTIVPSLFDRLEPGIVLDYANVEKGVELMGKSKQQDMLIDIKSAMEAVKVDGKIAVLGYCMGGTLAYVSANELSPTCAVSYYGTAITDHLSKQPSCPMLFHFGEVDPYVCQQDIELIRAANPQQPIYVYAEANHGFSCVDRASYHQKSAELAFTRTVDFLSKNLA